MADKVIPFKTQYQTVHGRIGVIDIGSNTVRLVVYDVPDRMPVPMFNEKAECRLVEGLINTGHLSAPGVERALQSLTRFIRLADAMGVETLDLVATAAVREASDGEDFVARIEDKFDVDVTILSGAEEAELSALGLVVGVPDATGVLGDLGGGSLDLVVLDQGRNEAFGTMPLGHVRLREMADHKIRKARQMIDEHLEDADWLDQAKGKNLYLSGGIMRAIARVFIEQTEYPLHVVDNFSIRRDDAQRLAKLLAGLSASTLRKMPSVSPARVKSLPFAAEVLGRLIGKVQPKAVVFSGFGMREGQMLRRLPPAMRRQDPLIAGARTQAERTGRFSLDGEEVAEWVLPLFPDANDVDRRRILAACLLSDIGWNEHPDYRAEHSFYRCLRLPFAGLSHGDRVFIAASVFVRYNGDPETPIVTSLRALLEEDELNKVDAIGRAIRLAHTISGSAPGLLSMTRMERKSKTLVLRLPSDSGVFLSETIERRFRSLTKSLGLRGSIVGS